MADVRVTTGTRSHVPGTMVGINVNTFGLQRLEEVSGADLMPIVVAALEPAREQLRSEWPVLTGASRDSILIYPMETGPHLARASLSVGGYVLIEDPRNVKHIDYAPFIEFNGTATAPAGLLLYAMSSNKASIREAIHSGVAALLQSRVA